LILNLGLSLVTAALLILTFPRSDIAWLAPMALAPLLVAAGREARGARRFLLGWSAGVVYWFGVCYWIQFVLEYHGGMGRFGSWGSFLLFCFAKAVHLGVFAWLAGFAIKRSAAAVSIPALWVAIEWTHGPLGFAWLALGNAGVDMGVPMRLAPYTGVYGLSFVFAMLNAALAVALLRRKRRELVWLTALPLLYLLPAAPETRPGDHRAALVQPNLEQDRRWPPEVIENMQNRLSYLSLQAALSSPNKPPQLLIWPEVPAPIYFYNDPQFRVQAINLARLARAWFLFGTVAYNSNDRPLNSAVLLSPSGDYAGRYDKMNLVPFGEFVPPLFGFVNRITKEAGDFAPGEKLIVFPVDGHGVGTFICYESVFPGFVRKFADQGAELFVNISNDGYFGRSAARTQHLKIARMRAAENRRWILRATNDGLTASIDPAGRIVESLPPYKEAAVLAQYSYISDKTFYTRYGDWFVAVCALIAVFFTTKTLRHKNS